MEAALITVCLVGGPLAAFVVILRLPSWFARSLHGHRMWRLRDAIADDIIDGTLPKEHPAVQQLLDRVESTIRVAKRVTLLDLYVFKFALKSVSPATKMTLQQHAVRCSRSGLDETQRAKVDAYWTRLKTLQVGSVLLGSWLGLLQVVVLIPRALKQAGHPEAPPESTLPQRPAVRHVIEPFVRIEWSARWSARHATDLAATTRLGQRVGVLAEQKRELATH